MIYQEFIKDLFSLPGKYYLINFIAPDLFFDSGMSMAFQKRFNLINKIKPFKNELLLGKCILIDNILNLVTKQSSCNRPSNVYLFESLISMGEVILKNKIHYIAISKNECEMEGVNFDLISKWIRQLFNDYDLEILVCRKKDKNMIMRID